MKRNSILLVNSTHKTKPWWVFVSVLLLVIIPFIIVWALVGEFNALDQNWLIAKGQSVWHGLVTNDNIDIIANKYQIFYDGNLTEELSKHINENMSILSAWTFFNPLILAPLFGALIIGLSYPMLFNVSKVSGLDVQPFATGSSFLMFSMILTGLIPVWSQNAMMLIIYFVVRLIISFIFGILSFMLTNFLVNKYLSTREYSADIIYGYKFIDKENEPAKSILKKNVDAFKAQKEQEQSYVDLPKEE